MSFASAVVEELRQPAEGALQRARAKAQLRVVLHPDEDDVVAKPAARWGVDSLFSLSPLSLSFSLSPTFGCGK
eukprot:12915612-Prorocentrum_lima.AAC.1